MDVIRTALIDFVKIEIRGCNKGSLLINERLDFKRKVSTSTGELDNKEVAEFHYLNLYVFDSGYIELSGSIHKAYNSIAGIQAPQPSKKMKGFNGNQFNYTQLRFMLIWLVDLIRFDPTKSKLRNIEFGVNVENSFNVPFILCNLMRHNGKPFRNPLPYYRQAEHYQYKVKCYFKSNQYRTPDNLLRFELQFKTMKKVNSLGVFNVSDLFDKNMLDELKSALIKAWGDVILYDYSINERGVKSTDRKWLVKYRNCNFWNIEIPSNRLDPHKKRLKRLSEDHSERIQDELRTAIEDTWTGLNVHCDTFNKLFGKKCKNSPFNYSMNAYTKPIVIKR